MVERRRIARANLYEITDSGFRCEDEIRYNDYEPTHHTQLFPYEVSITQKRVKDYKLVRTYWQARLSTDITDILTKPFSVNLHALLIKLRIL